jgi:hypothetical protein
MAPSESQSALDAQSKDAKRILAEDKYDDCLSCRITGTSLSFVSLLSCVEGGLLTRQHIGSAAFIGLGVYSYYTGMNNLRKQEQTIMRSATKYKMGSRKLGIATISATLVGMGIWRALN